MIMETQHIFCVDYAGSMVGYHSGFKKILDKRVLVTESPKFITPKEVNGVLKKDL